MNTEIYVFWYAPEPLLNLDVTGSVPPEFIFDEATARQVAESMCRPRLRFLDVEEEMDA